VDHHLVYDLLPSLARAYFARRLPASLSHGQAAILAVLGLQQRDVSACERELGLPANQVLALFNKVGPPLVQCGHICSEPTAVFAAC
jgi:N-acetyltransferase 10